MAEHRAIARRRRQPRVSCYRSDARARRRFAMIVPGRQGASSKAMLMWKNRVIVINDKQSLRCANFVPAAPAQLPEEATCMRSPDNVTIGAIETICELVKLQRHGASLSILAIAPRQIPCHAGFPLAPPARAQLHIQLPVRSLFPARDEMPAPPMQPRISANLCVQP